MCFRSDKNYVSWMWDELRNYMDRIFSPLPSGNILQVGIIHYKTHYTCAYNMQTTFLQLQIMYTVDAVYLVKLLYFYAFTHNIKSIWWEETVWIHCLLRPCLLFPHSWTNLGNFFVSLICVRNFVQSLQALLWTDFLVSAKFQDKYYYF